MSEGMNAAQMLGVGLNNDSDNEYEKGSPEQLLNKRGKVAANKKATSKKKI